MIKKIVAPVFISLFILALSGCAAPATPGATTSVPSSIPPTHSSNPTSTPLPPVEIPSEVPPTITATPIPENPIQHYPAGQEFTVTDIHMVDANTGWAIGGLGALVGDHVLFTSDGGSTWKDVTPPEPEAADGHKAATGYFQDARTAWVTYGIGGGTPVPPQVVVWHTQDGGLTWQASQPLDTSGLAEVYVTDTLQFVAGQNGWLLVHVGVGMNHDYVVLYRSTDGGASWSRILDPYSLNNSEIQSCSKNSMLFTDATHGWLTGDCNGVQAGVLLFQTSDSGSTWQAVTLPEPTGTPNQFEDMNFACGSYNPFFFSNDLGHIGVQCKNYSGQTITIKYYLYTTQNGGSTWTSNTYPGVSLYFFSADTGWALSSKIQQTTDGGATWKPISDVTWNARFDFISEQLGWAIAQTENEVALVKTDNGGARWSMLVPKVGP